MAELTAVSTEKCNNFPTTPTAQNTGSTSVPLPRRHTSQGCKIFTLLENLVLWVRSSNGINMETRIRQLESCPLGYPRLAAFNASEQNFMLYRGFSYVHACLLLDLQTSISALECELDEFDNEDNTDEQRLRLQCREEDIETAREAVSETGTKRRTRRDVLEELHNQVSKYSKYF